MIFKLGANNSNDFITFEPYKNKTMGQLLYYIIICLFLGLLFFNFYFRLKILKHFKILRTNKVQFEWKHIKSKSLLEKEVIPKYPKFKDDIRQFVHQIHFSLKIVLIIISTLILIGLTLVYG